MPINKTNQSGQIAIVILLIMVVLLTVGLSLASRTTQEVFLSQQEAESTRVFNAAESGIEDALSQDFSGIEVERTLTNVSIDDTDITTTIRPQQILETQITEGSTVHLDLSGNSGGNTITIDWSKQTGCGVSASLIASTYYDDGSITKAIHHAFGPNADCLDDFDQGTSGSSGYEYRYSIVLTDEITTGVTANPLFMRIKSIYSDTSLRISGANSNQLFVIRAEADNTIGDETRTIEVTRGISTAPSFMDYSVYSGGALQQ